jgi:hypothetical protein
MNGLTRRSVRMPAAPTPAGVGMVRQYMPQPAAPVAMAARPVARKTMAKR